MTAYREKTHSAAVLVPIVGAVLDTTATDAIGSGPHTGQPVATTPTRMRLTTERTTRTATDADLDVKLTRGGNPSVAGSAGAARFVWRKDGESDSMWRGWDPPTVVRRATRLATESVSEVYDFTSVCAFDDYALAAFGRWDGAALTLKVWRMLSQSRGGTAALVETIAPPDCSSNGQVNAIANVDGRAVLFFSSTTGTLGNVGAYSSDDEGVTWSRMATSVLPAGVSGQIRGLAVAARGEQILLLAWYDRSGTNARDCVRQYASADGGYSFALVDETPDDTGWAVGSVDVCADDRGFHVLTVNDSSGRAHYRRIGSAFQSFRLQDATTIASGVGTYSAGPPAYVDDARSAIVVSDSGDLFVFIPDTDTTQPCYQSTDGGNTWAEIGSWARTQTSGVAPIKPYGAWFDGRVVMLAKHRASVSTLVNSITWFDLGGYTNISWPRDESTDSGEHVNAERWWWPFDLPSDSGWTGSGTAAASIDSGILVLSYSGASKLYELAVTEDGTARCRIRVGTPDTRASVNNYDQIGHIDVSARLSGGDRWLVRIAFDKDGVYPYYWTGLVWTSWNAGASDVACDLTSDSVELLIGVHGTANGTNGSARLFYRLASDGVCAPWSEAGSVSTVTAVSGAPGAYVRFGADLAAGQYVYVYGAAVSGGISGDEIVAYTDADTVGRPVPTVPVLLSEHASAYATTGPADVGQAWTIGTEYDFPVASLETRSPRQAWRSDTVSTLAADTYVVWDLGDSAVKERGEMIALPLIGHNLPKITVGWQATTGGAWTSQTFNLGWTGVGYTRSGAGVSITVGSSGAVTPIRENELAGGTVWFGAGGKSRTILTNSGGVYPVLTLDGVDGTEGTSGNDLVVVPPRAVVFAEAGVAVRVKVPKEAAASISKPPGDEWTVGHCAPRRVLFLADDSDWGRTIENEARTDVADMPGGYRRTRVRGPARRTVTVSWADGVDTTRMGGTFDEVGGPQWTDGDSNPIGMIGEVPSIAEQLPTLLDGPDSTVVYVFRCPVHDAGLPGPLFRRDDFVYGTIPRAVRLDTVQGTEGVDEVIRVATVTIEEEP